MEARFTSLLDRRTDRQWKPDLHHCKTDRQTMEATLTVTFCIVGLSSIPSESPSSGKPDLHHCTNIYRQWKLDWQSPFVSSDSVVYPPNPPAPGSQIYTTVRAAWRSPVHQQLPPRQWGNQGQAPVPENTTDSNISQHKTGCLHFINTSYCLQQWLIQHSLFYLFNLL